MIEVVILEPDTDAHVQPLADRPARGAAERLSRVGGVIDPRDARVLDVLPELAGAAARVLPWFAPWPACRTRTPSI